MKQTYTIKVFNKATNNGIHKSASHQFRTRKDAIAFSQWCEYRGFKTEFDYDVMFSYESAIDNVSFLFDIEDEKASA